MSRGRVAFRRRFPCRESRTDAIKSSKVSDIPVYPPSWRRHLKKRAQCYKLMELIKVRERERVVDETHHFVYLARCRRPRNLPRLSSTLSGFPSTATIARETTTRLMSKRGGWIRSFDVEPFSEATLRDPDVAGSQYLEIIGIVWHPKIDYLAFFYEYLSFFFFESNKLGIK